MRGHLVTSTTKDEKKNEEKNNVFSLNDETNNTTILRNYGKLIIILGVGRLCNNSLR